GCPPGDRSGYRCPCAESYAGAWPPGIRPQRISNDRNRDHGVVYAICATRFTFPHPAKLPNVSISSIGCFHGPHSGKTRKENCTSQKGFSGQESISGQTG